MFGWVPLAAGALLVLACGREPIDPIGTGTGAGGGTATGTDTSNTTTTSVGTSQLSGVWSGEVQVSAPGFAWGPYDRLTANFAPDDTLTGFQFGSSILPARTFGAGAADFPLQGSRDVALGGGGYRVRVTMNTAQFASDHFDVRYHAVGIDSTPSTDYVEELSGQAAGGVLTIKYSLNGVLFIAPIAATASGNLRPN